VKVSAEGILCTGEEKKMKRPHWVRSRNLTRSSRRKGGGGLKYKPPPLGRELEKRVTTTRRRKSFKMRIEKGDLFSKEKFLV